MASHKAARINLRTTREQDTLIRRAADAQRKSVSEFVLEAACRSAESTLLDSIRRRFYWTSKVGSSCLRRWTGTREKFPNW
jgi:uncharacterized protein (DUF1778 family)